MATLLRRMIYLWSHSALMRMRCLASFICGSTSIWSRRNHRGFIWQHSVVTHNAPKAKRKGYSQNESPNVKTKAWAIVLLCTHLSEWVHFIYAVFQQKFLPGLAAKETCQNHSYSRVHLPFWIRILQEQKEKDWNLVSKFQSFYGRSGGIRTRGLLVPNQTRYQTAPHPVNRWYNSTVLM